MLNSVSAAEYEIEKFKQGQWYIYDGDVKTALLVNSTSEPQCYEFADVLILLEDLSQALDMDLLQNAARNGLANYHAFCSKKNQQGSKIRNVIAFIANGSTPNNFGRIASEDVLVSGRIITTGKPVDGVLEIRSNKVSTVQNSDSAGAKTQNKFNVERKLLILKEKDKLDAIRERFAHQYKQSSISLKPTGFLNGIFSGDSFKLTGAWSSSKAQCDHDVLLLIDNDGLGVVEWWRDTRNYGFLPWRSGSWNLKSNFLTLTFNHRVEFTFMNGFEDTLMDETVQLVLKSVSSAELHLTSPGPNSKALKLLRADEKLFIRCEFNDE